MLRRLQSIHQRSNRYAPVILALGLAGLAAYNWRQWQQDLALAEKLRTQPRSMPELQRTPGVSALVAAWNESHRIDAHIQSFLALQYPEIELILCAGGHDDTLQRARRYASERITVLEQHPGEGKQRALAKCFAQASGELIYLTDADCLFDDHSLQHLLAALVNDGEQVASGGSRPLPELLEQPFVFVQAACDLYMYSRPAAAAYLPGLLGRNTALSRAILQHTRGLEASAPTGTDYVLAKELTRAGIRIRQVRESQVASNYPANPWSYVRQRRRWLRNVALHGRRYNAFDEMRGSLQTSLLGAAMLVLPVSAVLLGPLVAVLWLLAFNNGLLARLRYVKFAAHINGQRPARRHALSCLQSLWLDFIAWSWPLLDYLRPRQRNQW